MWYAIHEQATGRLVSIASVIVDKLPAHLAVLELEERPRDDQMWDEAQGFIDRPAKVLVDRLEVDLKTDPAYAEFQAVYAKVSPEDQQKLDGVLVTLLGQQRYRSANEKVDLGET